METRYYSLQFRRNHGLNDDDSSFAEVAVFGGRSGDHHTEHGTLRFDSEEEAESFVNGYVNEVIL
jgi:hypothetical protein